ncbi:hypothetical protein JNW90_16820 [Micromonospora sp. STR1s_5]|nr:hypothetical protein [Micromonospora sp. STR1s_5]
MTEDPSAWEHVLAVTRPALLLASPGFLDDIANRLHEAGIQEAEARRDSAPIFDWLTGLIALQGISDAAAFSYDAEHGGITYPGIKAALPDRPSCPRLRCYWAFDACGYRKGSGECAEPIHRVRCPLPRHPLRKGGLNVAAYGLYLFIRDVCGGDLVGWIDYRLAAADPGRNEPSRAALMRAALVTPLVNIPNTGPKLWSMMLAELLLVGDPNRERWVTTGASMIAVDSLVHAFLHRTGSLRRFGAEHPYGKRCYGPGGCAEVIENLAARVDAREFNPAFPTIFPRFVQHSIWLFCAASGRDVCNGNRIDDRSGCAQTFCPSGHDCDRIAVPT